LVASSFGGTATGGGGRHCLFQHPDWPSKRQRGKYLGQGIDVKGDDYDEPVRTLVRVFKMLASQGKDVAAMRGKDHKPTTTSLNM
jgi:hypothetical protein